MKNSRRIIVYPSELHEYAYCPRFYFFSVHMGRSFTLAERIRLWIGRMLHWIKGLPDRAKGRILEERIEVEVGSNIVLRGRPDSYEVRGDDLVVIERKSGRGPSKGVWVSDSAQASAYAFMLTRLLNAKNALIKIEYLSRSRSSTLDEEKVSRLLKLIDEVVLVREHGIVPYAKRSARKCAKCPFRELCYKLDEGLEGLDAELYEPGRWLAEVPIDDSFS
ncbi:MAG: CRISPR-associated protein Cas4 [Desulfurococcales archaeon]|nr:CRISPR-associated protein Cas4 [Desulfurococcales archaeon]